MTSNWLLYLAAATGGQAFFALFYRWGLARLNAFTWNRAYLLGALLLPPLLPLVALPAAWAQWLWPVATGSQLLVGPLASAAAPGLTDTPAAASTGVPWLQIGLAAYWLGVLGRAVGTARSLVRLYQLSRRYPRTRLGQGWLVQLPAADYAAFSFGNHVFLSAAHAALGADEYAQLVRHEQAHGAQYHSLDLLLADVVGWFFWFNGLVGYLGRQLRTVHEYLADAAAVPAGRRASYGYLLLKLAAGPPAPTLGHSFATRQVALRLRMLVAPAATTTQKLRLLLAIPLVALAWLGAAALTPTSAAADTPSLAATARGRVGSIRWEGNTFLSEAQLTRALGLQPGDPYSPQVLDAQLAPRPDGSDITSRYLDQGYLFFQLTPRATGRPDGTTDLVFRLSEGRQATLGAISIRGSQRVPPAALLARLPLRSGDLFSRAKLVQAQQQLARSGQFVPSRIAINPQPVPRPTEATDLVNIALVVVEQ